MKSKIRLKLNFLVFIFLSAMCATSCDDVSKESTLLPNIIVFLVDDMGLMDTSVPFLTDTNGNPVKHPLNDYYKTPNMEMLAKQGIRFTNFYAHSVCSPTRTSILTGQNSARHKVTNWIKSEENNRTKFGPKDWNWKGLTKESVTLPRILQQEGYRTIHVGKAHFGPYNSEGEDPLNLGFDINIAGSSIGQPGSYFGTDGFGHLGGNKSRAVDGLEKYHGKNIFLTEALTLEANLAISKAKEEGKPFFLNMAHYAVHTPFQVDSRFINHYNTSGKSQKAQTYATLIEGIDKSLGDIIEHVKDLGLGENTLILFLGDNGSDAPLPIIDNYSSSSPIKGKKGSHYEGGMRIPFIASWISPNDKATCQIKTPIKHNTIQPQLGSILDIFPTLSRVANVNNTEEFILDGFLLQDQFKGKENLKRDELFLNHFPHSHRSSYFTSLVKSDWKIIYHYQVDSLPNYQLFNLKEDPFEANDVSDKNPEQLKIMMNVLAGEMKNKKALYPEKERQKLELIIP
ncbi:sulfatase-like hydrolase/transferase [Snuella sedimenti]|uniref:Sulfatase-like hydrolase/transferase n=1 Tax=Snuella sedimenti TaxID=2798802 RepID=A0A8J7J6K5_9FLAO|nr:sulfatase-like hydrolase/transferase [Snuella sedimenti]MBJ6369389.1 sulfatase-like hydrolase/transferase [Snuella sedimenti]